MKLISNLKKQQLKKIKLIVFDVDGVLVPRGTKIKQKGNTTTLETKKIPEELITQIKKLRKKGFYVSINSGRGLYMLQQMFQEVLECVSLTYENGSATWVGGKIIQHVNSFEKLKKVLPKLQAVKNRNIKGFEPKEFIISLHCKKRVKEIENILKKQNNLYCLWNGEAYDLGIKKIQTKLVGLKKLMKILKLKKSQVLVLGDNFNDRELFSGAGIRVTADKTRVEGDYCIDLDEGRFGGRSNSKKLPAGKLMEQILREV
jgi:hydroxymethylpyrimidine pyrophosphatase-like HAD family hydrolase